MYILVTNILLITAQPVKPLRSRIEQVHLRIHLLQGPILNPPEQQPATSVTAQGTMKVPGKQRDSEVQKKKNI